MHLNEFWLYKCSYFHCIVWHMHNVRFVPLRPFSPHVTLSWAWLVNKMVAHFTVRPNNDLYKKSDQKIEHFKNDDLSIEVANHFQLIYTLIQNNKFSIFHCVMSETPKNRYFYIKVQICWVWLSTSIRRSSFSKFPIFHQNGHTSLSLVTCAGWNEQPSY